jgi:DAK2 domain fusion protein YloV
MGARGNSGVILSQVFKGLAQQLEGRQDLSAVDLAHALGRARAFAYKAVGQPVEGTMLTVIGATVGPSEAAAEGGVLEVVEAACEAAREAVAMTPAQLRVLRDAGVVDAGGQGILVILEGMRRHLADGEPTIEEIAIPEPVGIDSVSGAVSQEFLDSAEEELYGYCTQFVLEGDGLDADEVRARMSESASSAVVIGTETVLRVHVHASDPDHIVGLAGTIGAVSQVNVADMDEQHRQFSSDRRAASEEGDAVKDIAVVAVAWGDGNQGVFRELGAAEVLAQSGVDNPSVRELSQAIEAVDSESVILLPNHPNVVPAAAQVAELSGGRVRVVEARSMPQGIAALLAFVDGRSVDQNVSDMDSAIAAVRTGEVCLAERDARVDGRDVAEGEVIGLLDRKLVAAGGEPADVLASLLRLSEVSSDDLVTIYWGAPVSSEDAAAALDTVEEQFSGAEVELVRGGQHGYHYIVSIE